MQETKRRLSPLMTYPAVHESQAVHRSSATFVLYVLLGFLVLVANPGRQKTLTFVPGTKRNVQLMGNLVHRLKPIGNGAHVKLPHLHLYPMKKSTMRGEMNVIAPEQAYHSG